MDSSRLQPAQVEQLRRSVARELNFHGRLVRRMERVGFPPDDPLYRAATTAYHGLLELHVVIHYCGCSGGVASAVRGATAYPRPVEAGTRVHPETAVKASPGDLSEAAAARPASPA